MLVSVKCDKNGIWYSRPYLGRTADGKVIQPYRQFPDAANEAEALEMANDWANHLTAYGVVQSALLFDVLTDYTEIRAINGASPNSISAYKLFTKYAGRYLTNKNARDLTAMDFTRFEQKLLMPKNKGGQGLARNSVINVHDFLRGAYTWFVEQGICDTNPLLFVSKPNPEKHEMAALDVGDFPTLYSALQTMLNPDKANKQTFRQAMNAFAAWLSLVTGCRVGEACAIRECDLYTFSNTLHIGGTVIEEKGKEPYRKNVTKGRKDRNLSINAEDVATIKAFLAMRDAVCGAFNAQTPLVTCNGKYQRPKTISRAFKNIAKKLNLPKQFSFHGLRHTHGTWLLINGVDIQTVSARLGHADEATTLRIYAHVLPGRDSYAANVFAQAVSNVTNQSKEVLQSCCNG